jgi:hypothetical protein
MKKQRCDCTTMPKTVIRENRKSGFSKKLCGTWSGIGSRFQLLILHLRLWKWSAVHHPDFKYFEISFTKITQVNFKYYSHSIGFAELHIYFAKPMLYLFEPMTAVKEFSRIHDLPIDTIHSDIPF